MRLSVKINQTPPAGPLAAYQQPVADSTKASGYAKPQSHEDGGHYYGVDKTAVGANGDPVWVPLYEPNKSYTLREARALRAAGGIAIPSVTTYFKAMAKPQLERWKQGQAAGAMFDSLLTGSVLPRSDQREDAIKQSLSTAGNASRGAMDLGTRIHGAIEDAVRGKVPSPDMKVYVDAVLDARAGLGITASHPEQCVGSLKYGYAGRCDDYTDDMQVIDYKSRKSRGNKVTVNESDPMQLAAYGYAKFGNAFFRDGKGHIFAISTTTPGLLTVHTFTGPQLVLAFQTFLALTQVWRFAHNFDPRYGEWRLTQKGVFNTATHQAV